MKFVKISGKNLRNFQIKSGYIMIKIWDNFQKMSEDYRQNFSKF